MIETEKLYEQKKAERNSHIEIADEILEEMTRLQGEYRLLQKMEKESLEQPKTVSKSKKTATTEAEKVVDDGKAF